MVEKRSKKLSVQGKGSRPNTLQNTIDYKNVLLLRKFITIEGKILPRRLSSLTAKQHRAVAKAIKNARMMGLLPFVNKD
uniref:Small ribosomal subunit protein bS18c n=1 Tax=Pedinomonas tuberculata TaxID=160064 RepID=A0A097KL57_9CHLO|nr:ribosomal protein S18 [Pedinomonas tuberculata]AIT93935.1 ribosomal protein S18 [Pedinomonas tuberculata]